MAKLFPSCMHCEEVIAFTEARPEVRVVWTR